MLPVPVFQAEANIPAYREVREQAIVLVDVTDAPGLEREIKPVLRVRKNRFTKLDAAELCLLKPCDDVQQARFPCA